MRKISALVDIGVTHCFVSMVMARDLGLTFKVHTSQVKVVNSQATKIQGLGKNVRVCLGEFEGRMDLMVIEIDDFEEFFGNTFLTAAYVGVLPHLGGVIVMHKAGSCFVHGHKQPSKVEDRAVGVAQLSAMELACSCKRRKLTYLLVMVEVKPNQVVGIVPNTILEKFEEFTDVMGMIDYLGFGCIVPR